MTVSVYRVLGAGRFYLALESPDQAGILKIRRPDGPLRSDGWKSRIFPEWDRQKGLSKVTTSEGLVRRLLDDPDFSVTACFPRTRFRADLDLVYEWAGHRHRHRGWAYHQDQVEVFDDHVPLNAFTWKDLPTVQHILWSRGIGLRSGAETWGPRSWSIETANGSAGSVRLADLSSLTPDRGRVAKRLSDSALKKRRRVLLRKQPEACRHLVDAYLTFLRQHLNVQALDRRWGRPLEPHP